MFANCSIDCSPISDCSTNFQSNVRLIIGTNCSDQLFGHIVWSINRSIVRTNTIQYICDDLANNTIVPCTIQLIGSNGFQTLSLTHKVIPNEVNRTCSAYRHSYTLTKLPYLRIKSDRALCLLFSKIFCIS